MRKDVNLSFEDDVIWSYIKDREILPFEKDLRVKASIAKGGIKGGSFFSAMLPFSWFISEDQLYTTKRKFHFFNISRDPWIIEKDLSTLKKKDSIFLFFMIAASQKIPTLPTYFWCDLSARKLKMFFFLKKSAIFAIIPEKGTDAEHCEWRNVQRFFETLFLRPWWESKISRSNRNKKWIIA